MLGIVDHLKINSTRMPLFGEISSLQWIQVQSQ